MVKVRQDAWSHEDDLLLAETVLRHIREGSTQLNAFEEVGDKLNRTSAACGFRWNAEVRQRYDQAVDIAKRQRKEKKRQLTSQQKQPSNSYVPNWEQKEMEEDTSISINQFNNHEVIDGTTNRATTDINSIDLDSVIRYLRSLKKDVDTSVRSKQNAEKLRQERDTLTAENQKLQKEINKLEKQLETVQVDYQAFLQIMDRARKMVVFSDQDESASPAFRMEKNGNLEQVAK
ncbi:transcriptional regulator [Paraliobacillus quinghaiensis]|uniref:Transcriptional regulator n=1 Tax=Paraliobacillus quinghaiensis TaxID=470815 RepID=A0A917TPP5_9BACI|nr:RsfA family transcriptional regulator [Paraliobacillus quinghaiensis]GGM30895.1 transcriptional regulator [Paraliobacillus quinghaiensis]